MYNPTTAPFPLLYKCSFVYRHFQEIALLHPRLLPTVLLWLTPPPNQHEWITVFLLEHFQLLHTFHSRSSKWNPVALAHSPWLSHSHTCAQTRMHAQSFGQRSKRHQACSQNNDLSLLPRATSSFAEKYSASKLKQSSPFDILLPVLWNTVSSTYQCFTRE